MVVDVPKMKKWHEVKCERNDDNHDNLDQFKLLDKFATLSL